MNSWFLSAQTENYDSITATFQSIFEQDTAYLFDSYMVLGAFFVDDENFEQSKNNYLKAFYAGVSIEQKNKALWFLVQSCIHFNELQLARFYLTFVDDEGHGVGEKKKKYYYGILAFREKKRTDAKRFFIAACDTQKQKNGIDSLFELANFEIPDRKKAFFLNATIPPGGYLYLNQKQKALFQFMKLAVWGVGSYTLLKYGYQWFDVSSVAVPSFEYIYMDGLDGVEDIAEKQQKMAERKFMEDVYDILMK